MIPFTQAELEKLAKLAELDGDEELAGKVRKAARLQRQRDDVNRGKK
jgi:hypothetical protein